ncbi:hypothetical protein RDI58_022579 [Solanum bulbocastanum]|uniref:Uncharacterized protein n=1 Tax=Solanum bulbocastanum TaxID=147425 RepID=A0AAN8T2B7_SOLBU
MTMLNIDTLEKDDKILRAAMLKKRYANVIMKSQKQVLGKVFDEKKYEEKGRIVGEAVARRKSKVAGKR